MANNKNFDKKDKCDNRKNGYRKKGNKPYDKNKERKTNEKSADELGNVNDASTYFSNPELLSQVTNISFNEYLGVPVDIDQSFPDVVMEEKVSNVTTFFMNPSVQPTGYADTARYSSINVVGFKNYLLLSANNAKTTSYAPQDVTCLILAIGQVLAMYSFLRRPFGCIYLINQRNRSYPELLFKAMGINYADFRANVADYRIKFNELIAMFDRIPFFSEIPYFDKCKNMYDFIYVDEDSPLAQTYLFVPQTTWTIDEAYSDQGTGLVTTEVVSKSSVRTFDEYLGIFSDMIQALATSTTFNAVFSDVLRVVSNGKGKTLVMDVISEAYAVTPVINQEIRHWINNVNFIHTPDDKDAFPGSLGVGATNYNDVASLAEQNGILYNPIFSVFGNDHNASDDNDTAQTHAFCAYLENGLINFDSMAPSVEDRISATRLAVRAKIKKTASTVAGKYFYTLDKLGLGDYYSSGVVIYTDVADSGVTINYNVLSSDGSGNFNAPKLKIADLLGKLKYAPRIMYQSSGDNNCVAITGDLTYYTLLDYGYMKRLKDVEALTEFAINI